MLRTRLKHVETDGELDDLLENTENLMLCCGRMGPMCVPVYTAMQKLEGQYQHVAFRDMDFDGPVAHRIRSLAVVQGFTGLPFTVYFKKGKPVAATTSIQDMQQIIEILDREFGQP